MSGFGGNIFFGQGFTAILKYALNRNQGATIFGCKVKDTERFGMVEFDENNKAMPIKEKPSQPRSNYAVMGLYFYGNQVIDIAKQIRSSERGELEITEVNRAYLQKQKS